MEEMKTNEHHKKIEDKGARCKLCGKTIEELVIEGYPFDDDTMVCVGTDYHNAVCPACIDVIDDRIIELLSEKNGFIIEVLKDNFPKLLFYAAISMQAQRNACSVDEALKSLIERK